ncbi:ribulokinase [Paenibacillus sp. JCM 10914]|uniref:ribulokinase n=1 Tax=Paenibacillus sp. JCM 10914 TaxID=1236974 RepID=UPI0003CC3EAA|nr:ribulokinase [Paenibacillus sp. JCM 10914]GAE07226.1 ribulokinase [Paenibacillus sp. JCM 10914]
MKQLYAIGVDYGTESGRALLVDLSTGQEVATHVTPYRHGVIEDTLPDSDIRLGYDWALQHPEDYIEVLQSSIPHVLAQAGIEADQVIGIGVDFTACTMMPLDAGGTPLCLMEKWKHHPHAWVKLWKHHAAQEEANRINEAALARDEKFLARHGGKVSSEWMLAKSWQILNEAPEIYEEAVLFMEAADWIVMQMTGQLVRSSCTAGYKANWHKREGFPSKAFLRSLDSRLEDLADTKLRGRIQPLGARAGGVTDHMAALTGLAPGTAVATGIIDAHAMVPAVSVVTPGKLVLTMGTSTCHLLISDKEVMAEGICGVVEDGIIPGYYGYEAGQSAVGDIFAWYVEQAAPDYVHSDAAKEGISVHEWLERAAGRCAPGESGLLALDWWNGSRSVLMDADLSGVMLGLNLQTKPEDIYRSLLEATAFGTRAIIEAFTQSGVDIQELYACGGLPQKNRLLMQIYADVTGKEIKIADTIQTAAFGAAMFGAVAAGKARGGFDSIVEAADALARVREETFQPIESHVEIYNRLYREYQELHDYFGRGGNMTLKRLKALRTDVTNRKS